VDVLCNVWLTPTLTVSDVREFLELGGWEYGDINTSSRTARLPQPDAAMAPPPCDATEDELKHTAAHDNRSRSRRLA
jgi:hypothetical protein